jgi:glycosyltransferase involved in cell wall biosynthesis
MPLVSVVLPTYNRKEVLKDAISSVLSQTVRDIELIVVDDNSTDGTQSLVESVKDSRLKYSRNMKSKGAQGARNTGIDLAQGKWVSFLDSDDIWNKKKIEREIYYIDNIEEDIYSVSCGYKISRNKKVFWRSEFQNGEFEDKSSLLYSNPVGSFSSLTARKDVLVSLGGLDESLTALQDRDVLFRLCSKFNLYTISDNLVTMRVTDEKRISDDNKKLLVSLLYLYKKYKKYIEREDQVLYCMRADIARLAFLSRSWGIFAKNMPYIFGSTLYCSGKVVEFAKSVLLSSEYIRRFQVKLFNIYN